MLIYIIAHFVSQDSCIFSVLSYFSVDGDRTSITKRGASVKVFPCLDFVRQFIGCIRNNNLVVALTILEMIYNIIIYSCHVDISRILYTP